MFYSRRLPSTRIQHIYMHQITHTIWGTLMTCPAPVAYTGERWKIGCSTRHHSTRLKHIYVRIYTLTPLERHRGSVCTSMSASACVSVIVCVPLHTHTSDEGTQTWAAASNLYPTILPLPLLPPTLLSLLFPSPPPRPPLPWLLINFFKCQLFRVLLGAVQGDSVKTKYTFKSKHYGRFVYWIWE